MRLFFVAFFSLLFLSKPALAYLDPGTGSLLLQALVALVAGSLMAIKIYWSKIKLFFRKKDTDESD